jgi:hypothetical protein
MFPISPTSLMVPHRGQSGGRGLSPRLWGAITGQAGSPDGNSNWFFSGSDFLNFAATTPVAANVGRYAADGGGYLSYEDTGNSISNLATEVGGVIRIATDGTDNDETWLQPGTATSVLGVISNTSGADKRMIFESRFRVGSIADGAAHVFIGLTEEGLAAADTVTDAGAMGDKDFIGFRIAESAGNALTVVYRKAGQVMQTLFTYGTALAASTWVKAGFVYNPQAPASKRIRFYIDNVEQSTYITATQIAAALFPNGEELNFLAGFKNGGANARSLDLDWWYFGQQG